MERVRVGIIGSGFSAALHAEALRQVHGLDVTLAAVAGRDHDKAKKFAARHGIATAHAHSYDLLADDDVDVVCLCVPNAAHAPLAIEAAQAGKHVICEKPLTGAFTAPSGLDDGDDGDGDGGAFARTALEEALTSADAVLDAMTAAGRRLMYAENWVYAPAVTKAKRLLGAAGGSILDIRAEESHSGSHAQASKYRARAGGGALLMLGSHPIGAALHLKAVEGRRKTGQPVRVRSVVADTAPLWDAPAYDDHARRWLVSDWVDVETWASAILTFTDGTKAVINASFGQLGGVRNTLELATTNAVLRANMTPNDALLAYAPHAEVFGAEYLSEKLETKAGWSTPAPDEDWVRGYPQEMQDFCECVTYDREPLSDATLARDVVEVIYAAYLSAETGRRINLPVSTESAGDSR
ncbi:Gfo/Idh/MocA family oxidoreductase [Actinopolymorpha sp. B9G3]|uniref:Gfo/Idh/MocA family protein n=1 Tax=Actinopolymorpha sp. B9G3 TaxID=3158970 RepID=UPI0032D8DE84